MRSAGRLGGYGSIMATENFAMHRALLDPREFLFECINQQQLDGLQEMSEEEEPASTERTSTNFNSILSSTMDSNSNSSEPVGQELIYTVSLYHSRPAHWRKKRIQTLKIIGSNSLCQFRDALFCLSDFLHLGDLPEIRNTVETKVSPSFIFIENKFYVDDRPGRNLDYLDPVKKYWSRISQEHPDTPTFIVKSMQTCFLDIPICIDEPYLLHHQDDCGHVFIIDEIRFVNAVLDPPLKSQYPHVLKLEKVAFPNCCICELDLPKFVVYSDQGPYMGSLWCPECFQSFFGDEYGNIRRDLEYFPYNLDFEF